MTASSPNPDFTWLSRDREACLIAQLLRDSRLMVLYGEAGAGKTTLLKVGVLPLLRRRAGDRNLAQAGESRVVVPFPDRRGRDGTAQRGAEIAIFFDAWNEAPLSVLQARIFGALPIGRTRMAPPSLPLADSLAAWSKELDVRFLIILDRFDAYLAAPLDHAGIREFADEFARVVSEPLLPTNFLISLRDEKPLLERFQDRIASLPDACLRLPALRRSTAPTPEAMTAARVLAQPEPERPQKRRIKHAAAPAAAAIPLSPANTSGALHRSRAPSLEARQEADSLGPAMAAVPALAEPERPQIRRIERSAAPAAREIALSPSNAAGAKWRPALKWLAVPLACAALLLMVRTTLEPSAEREPAQVPAQAVEDGRPIAARASVAPPAPAAAPALPKVALLTDPGNSTDIRIARDLARAVAADVGIELVARSELPLRRDDSTPLLAILRYDALQAARTAEAAGGEAIDGLRVVTPLYTEEIHFIARSDSRLAFIHEIQGAKINLGPARSGRGLTAVTLYERMFGTPIPADASFLGDDEALSRLVTDKTIDAMVVVAAQPATWLANLVPKVAQSIKLLKLDAEHPASRRAIEGYLPATVRAASYGRWPGEDAPTLAVMSFLVTSDYADAGAVERLGTFARSLCRNLPVLRREGHPKWREVLPGFQLDAGWPYSAPAEAELQSCRPESPAESLSQAVVNPKRR